MEGFSLEELQAQFRQIQKEESVHRLSERNCVEIIMKLIDLNLLHVIYTLNGREYVTPQQLEREIKDEILLHKGRINVVELQPLLNMDLTPIENKLEEMMKKDRSMQLIDGEIITGYYLDGVAEEINGALQEAGHVTISEMSQRFGLTAEFIEPIVAKRIGKSISGHLENGVLYTNAFLERYSAKIRGIFSAITRPTPIGPIIARHNFQERLFFNTIEVLINSGRIDGSIQGKRDRAVYVPFIFSNAREEWVDSFFNQNGYIDYQTLEKLDFTNPRTFLENRFSNGLALRSYYVSRSVVSQLDSMALEAIESQSWVDLLPLAPSVLSPSDIAVIVQHCPSVVQQGKSTNAVLLDEQFIASKGFLDKSLQIVDQFYKERADKGLLQRVEPSPDITSAADDDDEDEKPKKRGGQQSRGKSKGKQSSQDNNKKGGKKQQLSSSSSSAHEKSPILEEEDKLILETWQKQFEDAPIEFLELVLVHVRSMISQIREQHTRAIFVAASNENRQKNSSFQEDLNTLYSNIQLFHKGIEVLGEDEAVMEKYLLKSLCNDLVNMLLLNQAMTSGIQVNGGLESIKTPSDQNKIISQLPPPVATAFQKLAATVNGKTSKEFLDTLESVESKFELQLKPLDKRREKQLLLTHRQTLMDQLMGESNPATALHLIVVLLFLKKHNVVLHAPGRSINTILAKLKADLPQATFAQLSGFQAKVVKFLTADKNVGLDPAVESALNEELPIVKEIVLGKDETAGIEGKREDESDERPKAKTTRRRKEE